MDKNRKNRTFPLWYHSPQHIQKKRILHLTLFFHNFSTLSQPNPFSIISRTVFIHSENDSYEGSSS